MTDPSEPTREPDPGLDPDRDSTSRRAFLRALASLGTGAVAGASGVLSARDLLAMGGDAAAGARNSDGTLATSGLATDGGGLQDPLPTRPIPSTGEEIPIVGFGSTKSVLESPTEGTEPIANVIEALLEYGGSVVDTSPRTPEIDEEFGAVLDDPRFRDEIFLATKIYTRGEEAGVEQMRQNRRLLGPDGGPLDLVQIESLMDLEVHWPNLRGWKESGETRYTGVTVFRRMNHERLEGFMRAESPDFVHMNYNLIEPEAEEVLLPLARDRGMAAIINRPFMNGEWFGITEGRELPEWAADFDCVSWAQFSLKYILAHPAVTCVLTETTDPEHMDENIRAGLGRLPDEAERQRMRELVATF